MDNLLPHDAAAERAVLGAVLLDNRRFNDVREELTIDDFYRSRHKALWVGLATLAADGSPMDLVTLRDELERQGKLDEAGGVGYIGSLVDGEARSANISGYARILKEKTARRVIVCETEHLAHAAMNGSTSHELLDALTACRHKLNSLGGTLDPSRCPVKPIDLYGSDVAPVRPQFTVANLIRHHGLHLIWAAPSTGKTWTLLRWVHELLVDTGVGRLSGHPDLLINHRYNRVLWMATEEDASTLRFKAEQVRAGLGIAPELLAGRLRYVFAAADGQRITLDDLPALLGADRYNCIILDSLTGLRPKTVNGVTVHWDVDNDAANEICLRLRGLATRYSLAIVLVHHTGRDTTRGYRGPTDWWSSADVMIGLVPDADRVKVVVEKNRDGRRIAPFCLVPAWDDQSYDLTYGGLATPVTLSKTEEKVLAWISGRGQASQREMIAAGIAARTTVQEAIKKLAGRGSLVDTGTKANGSPVFRWVPERAGDGTGTPNAEK